MKLISNLKTRRWLLVVLGLAFFYFYSGGGPNQASRFNLDRALLEHHELRMDRIPRQLRGQGVLSGPLLL